MATGFLMAVLTSSASMIDGTDMTTSVRRMMSQSAMPPANAATLPRTMPTPRLMVVTKMATVVAVRAPHRMRLSTSRPNWSVPSQWSALGGSLISLRFCSMNG
jgi:hypothetical protein